MQSHNNPLGDFTLTERDVEPSKFTSRVTDSRAFARLSVKLYDLHSPRVGRALTKSEESEFLKSVYLDIVIPDDVEQSVNGKYVSQDLINSDIPERLAESKIDILNSIDIPEEELEELKAVISEYTLDMRDTLLTGIVPFLAFDNASAIVEAMMRDGLGVSLQVDSSVLHALQDITKLSVISKVLERSDLDGDVRRKFMEKLTETMTSDITELRKKENAQRYSQFLHNLVASRNSVPESSQLENNPMGIIKRRSK